MSLEDLINNFSINSMNNFPAAPPLPKATRARPPSACFVECLAKISCNLRSNASLSFFNVPSSNPYFFFKSATSSAVIIPEGFLGFFFLPKDDSHFTSLPPPAYPSRARPPDAFFGLFLKNSKSWVAVSSPVIFFPNSASRSTLGSASIRFALSKILLNISSYSSSNFSLLCFFIMSPISR